MEKRFTGRVLKDQKALHDILHMDINVDVNMREFMFLKNNAVIFYLEGMVSSNMLQAYIIKPCLEAGEIRDLGGTVKEMLTQSVLIASSFKEERDIMKAAQALTDGQAVLLCETMNTALIIDIREFVKRPVGTPLTEAVVIGQQQGFNESLRDNITLIRRLIHSTDLISEMTTVGETIPTALSILYIKDVASEELVDRLKDRLKNIKVDCVLSIGILEQLIEDHPYALLPQGVLTERCDRAASFLLEGQIVILIDGSPMALGTPINFFHLLHTSDDTNMRWQYGSFIRLLRFIGVFTTLYLPGVFVALTMYHLEAMPLILLDTIMESQSSVPLSVFMETIMMLVIFNLITEAGSRVPGLLGNSMGIVAGLIMGQAAVEANLINPLLIIVSAMAGLGGHAIPNYSLSMAFRIMQIVLVCAATLGGMFGMTLVTIVLLCGLCGMSSLGLPYMAPLSPKRSHNPDVFFRMPVWQQRFRTYIADENAKKRSDGRMRLWERKRP